MKLNLFFGAAMMAALLSAQNVFAQARAETYKDIIEKAYNLSLQKDRQQALNILLTALQKETRPQNTIELRKAVNDVGHVFISDKAQQMYETAISLRKSDLTQSLAKLNEALRIESDNLTIVTEMGRVMIAKGDCSGAQDAVIKQSRMVPYDEELKLVSAQAYECLSQWVEYGKLYDSNEVKKSPLQKFWLVLEVERYFKIKNFPKAQEIVNNLKKIDPKYPEVSYWSWKLGQQAKGPGPEDAQKYVMTCKNISANQYRQYMIDPGLCRHVLEVEADLKGANGTSE